MPWSGHLAFGGAWAWIAIGGPVFLVYYGPALIRAFALQNARGALVLLSEVYRAARVLWPLTGSADVHVLVSVAELLAPSAAAVFDCTASGTCWVLVRTDASSGEVQSRSIHDLPRQPREADAGGPTCEVLQTWLCGGEG